MTDGSSFDDPTPQTWLEAFPWLGSISGPHGDNWWNEAIDVAGASLRDERLGRVSELAISRLARWTIGEIFPGLPADLDLTLLDLPGRAATALKRANCRRGVDLANLPLDSIMDWRQVGLGTIDVILRALARASTTSSTPRVWAASPDLPHPSAALNTPNVPSWIATMIDDLTQVATWYATAGLADRRLIGDPLSTETPGEIVKARTRLEELRADDVLMDGELETDAAALLDEALAALDPRAREVLAMRLFADQPRTLDDLGADFGVSRERVRQVEGKARAAILACVSDGGPLTLVADTARALVGSIRPLDDLIAALPALGQEVISAAQPVWRVLDRLDDTYEIEDGWCAVPTVSSAREWTRTRLQELADDHGVVRLEDVDLVRTNDPARAVQLAGDWLTHCGFVVDGPFVLTRTGSVADYGAAVLSMVGSPLSAQEIVDRFVVERTSGSLRNAMSSDDRFERVDRDKWALAEWGMEAYAGIRTVIREQVAQHGGSIRLDDLVEHITARYTVAANSVVIYASAPPFACREGVVRLASGGAEVRKTPERTRHLYRRTDNWAYRVRITTDHLRGSGFVAPVALAGILGLDFGETRHLESPIGEQVIAWTGTQPSFGTIRRLLVADDVPADSEVLLVIFDDGRFGLELVREMSGDPLLDALALVGAPIAGNVQEARQLLAEAVRLPESTPTSSIIGRYRERGDGTIADLLTSAKDLLQAAAMPASGGARADVDEILDLL